MAKMNDRPLLNPNMRFNYKDQEFFAVEEGVEAFQLTPMAFFVCSRCDGSKTVNDIIKDVRTMIENNGFTVPENIDLDIEITNIIDILSTKGVLFLK